jgi:hypothetical protein
MFRGAWPVVPMLDLIGNADAGSDRQRRCWI